MRYWKVYRKFPHMGRYISLMRWYIEHDDGSYTQIKIEGNPNPKSALIEKSKRKPTLSRDNKEILGEVDKDEVDRALKIALRTLDLPKEINILTHKF